MVQLLTQQLADLTERSTPKPADSGAYGSNFDTCGSGYWERSLPYGMGNLFAMYDDEVRAWL